MIKRVMRLKCEECWSAYAPPVEPCLINLTQISVAVPRKTRRPEPCVELRMMDGSVLVVTGVVEDFIPDNQTVTEPVPA